MLILLQSVLVPLGVVEAKDNNQQKIQSDSNISQIVKHTVELNTDLMSIVSVAPEQIEQIETPFEMPQIKRPVFPNRIIDIRKYGAVGDGKTLNTKAISKAITFCAAAGGGQVLIPAGKWLTGAIHLQSNVNLYLQEGAEIHFSDNPQDYLPVVFTRWAGFEVMNYSPLIYANRCENIAITGSGKLFGHGEKWWPWEKGLDEKDKVGPFLQDQAIKSIPPQKRIFGNPEIGLRPQFISLINCRNVLLENFTVAQPGPFWTIQFIYCENVIARTLTLHTKGGPNTDGINLDSSRNALIEYCLLDVGDDAVCLKSGCNEDGWRVGKATENIVVRHITAMNCHGGIVIGSEMSGNVRNVFVKDCLYNGSDNGIRLKSNASRGGVVENIFYKDITMHNIKKKAIVLESNYVSWAPSKNGTNYPTFKNITIQNVDCDSAEVSVDIKGNVQKPIENLTLCNVKINARQGMKFDWVHNLILTNVSVSQYFDQKMSTK